MLNRKGKYGVYDLQKALFRLAWDDLLLCIAACACRVFFEHDGCFFICD